MGLTLQTHYMSTMFHPLWWGQLYWSIENQWGVFPPKRLLVTARLIPSVSVSERAWYNDGWYGSIVSSAFNTWNIPQTEVWIKYCYSTLAFECKREHYVVHGNILKYILLQYSTSILNTCIQYMYILYISFDNMNRLICVYDKFVD